MAAGFKNTGRFGYGGHLGGSGGGIDTKRINKLAMDKELSADITSAFTREFKQCIKLKKWDDAFEVLCDAVDAEIITKQRFEEIVKSSIPCMKK